jgi:hypothetical protein
MSRGQPDAAWEAVGIDSALTVRAAASASFRESFFIAVSFF